jgi:Ca2+-transporting ATPase
MFPEAKLAAVESLKKDHQVVAMLGDGVNDGPALKRTHRIAMGNRALKLQAMQQHWCWSKMIFPLIDGIAAGRQFIPILKATNTSSPFILMSHRRLPLLLGWIYPVIMLIHVVFS